MRHDLSVRADRRTEILEATCRVIVRDGAPGVRIAAIAREAGVSNALPLYYEPSVEALIRAAFAHHEQREWARANARVAELDDPVAVLRYLLEDELDDTPFARGNAILWSEVERLATFDKGLSSAVAARRARYDASLATHIQAAQAIGAVPHSVDAVASARLLTALVDGLVLSLRLGVRTHSDVRGTLNHALATELGLAPLA